MTFAKTNGTRMSPTHCLTCNKGAFPGAGHALFGRKLGQKCLIGYELFRPLTLGDSS